MDVSVDNSAFHFKPFQPEYLLLFCPIVTVRRAQGPWTSSTPPVVTDCKLAQQPYTLPVISCYHQPEPVKQVKACYVLHTRGQWSTVVSAQRELTCQIGSQFYLPPNKGKCDGFVLPIPSRARYPLSHRTIVVVVSSS